MADGKVPFLEMFPFLAEGPFDGIVKNAVVLSATVNEKQMTMELLASFAAPVPPVRVSALEEALAQAYGLKRVSVSPVYAASAAPKPKKAASGGAAAAKKGKTIFGRVSGKVIPMAEVDLDAGNVTVEGTVFSVTSRDIQKSGAHLLCFDMTDGTNSVRVSRFITEEELKAPARSIQPGMCLTVSGTVGFSRFDGDLTLTPRGIAEAEAKPPRADTAEDKRVELHLHTSMSAMDAVTDVADLVERAVSWGHPAIAITDHGGCQAFPDAMKAAGDKIKVLYGIEGYYVNDVDDRVAVSGSSDEPLDGGIVAFDIETTGLDSRRERITEIGAVLFRGGRQIETFHTYVNSERHISAEITRLTGITDEMVADAPGEEEAIRQFLAFAEDVPLAAHNAAFDIGFIDEACRRHGMDFDPVYVDTLALAQAMRPELKNHRLDTVARALELPDFEHHRATDDAVTCGLILLRLFEEMRRAGVAALSGVNEYIRPLRREAAYGRRMRPQHICILARTQAGLKNLYRIVTKSYLEHLKRYPTIPKSLLMTYREGLLIGSACEAGEVFRAVVDHRSRAEQRRIASFYDYLEIQPLANNLFLLAGEKPKAADEEELRDFNRRVVELGEELGKPVCATGDVHFLDPEEEIFRHILLTAKEFDDADKPLPLYFRTTDEMLNEFAYLGAAKAHEVVVANPRAIADACEAVRPLPPAKTLFAPKIENSAGQLRDLVYGRMRELYGDEPPELVTKRVETELGDIIGQHYDVIYMTAQKLVADSLAHGYLVGSRGSVGSSVVAFLSGITEVNALPPHYRCPQCHHTEFVTDGSYGCGADLPDKPCPVCGAPYDKDGFDIPFETFLGFGGDKVPDIDLNFSGEYQANAHRYTTELFGADHVFRAGTIGTLKEKTAYGYVKKYLEKTGRAVSRAEEARLAAGCVGVKRTTGQHPGGLVVIPQDMEITDFCPAQHPADDPDTDIVTTHFEYHCMEDNLLKLDELGHDDPTMIKMLEDMTGVNARKIPLDDPDTMRIFRSPEPLGIGDDDPIIGKTGTIGIPEFGTGFTRQMLVDTQPKDFDTLLRLSGFSHGTDVWLGNAKDLITSGVAGVKETIGCRDDIMLYLIARGMEDRKAFKIMETVRKKNKLLSEEQEAAMRALGVPEWYIESCRKIQYLFPKAHAVAYVMMAFRIAWFKVHYPKEYYSAYFYRRSQKDAFDAELMTRSVEALRAKIRELQDAPDATAKDEDLLTTLEACYEFRLRGLEFENIDLYKSDPVKFLLTEHGLRPPFVAVSGLGEAAAYDLAEKRQGRQFISIEELSDSCPKLSRAHVEQLKSLGALDGLTDTSQISLF